MSAQDINNAAVFFFALGYSLGLHKICS